MKNPPRDPKTPVITKQMIIKIVFGSLIMLYGTLSIFFHYISQETNNNIIVKEFSIRKPSTIAFTTFVMFQMFNALNCRSSQNSVFRIGLFSNKYFLLAIGGSILMQLFVIYIPFLQYIFETTSLSLEELFSTIIVSSTVFILDEVLKRLKLC